MLKYGAKLGKDSNQVFSEMLAIRMAARIPATTFSLSAYQTGERISLDDLKGKIILLTYWYPGCGPCRAEFPHFENVVKKFSPKKLAYLGINGISTQDDYVIPFMKSTKYSFTALRDDENWDKGNLTEGYPVNYLIDQNGNIIHSGFRIHADNEDMLELMIAELIDTPGLE